MKAKFVLSAVCVLPVLAAAAEQLDIRTGTWEIAATTQIGGAPPLPRELLESMSPEQRADIEAAFKAQAGKRETDVTRECITSEDLERPFSSANTEDCTQEIVRSTRTAQEARLVCNGEYKGSGVLRVTASDPETMTASLDLRVGEGQDAMTIKSEMKGRWLSADCEEDDEYEYEEDEADSSADDEYDEPEDE